MRWLTTLTHSVTTHLSNFTGTHNYLYWQDTVLYMSSGTINKFSLNFNLSMYRYYSRAPNAEKNLTSWTVFEILGFVKVIHGIEYLDLSQSTLRHEVLRNTVEKGLNLISTHSQWLNKNHKSVKIRKTKLIQEIYRWGHVLMYEPSKRIAFFLHWGDVKGWEFE